MALAVDARTVLGESPVWDDRTGCLYYVDINERRLHGWVPSSGAQFSVEAPEHIGCVMLCGPDTGKVLLGLHRSGGGQLARKAPPFTYVVNSRRKLSCCHRRVVVVDVDRKALGPALAMTPEAHGIDDMRFNDGKGAPGGELIIGRMHSKWREGNPGKLYRRAPPASLYPADQRIPFCTPGCMCNSPRSKPRRDTMKDCSGPLKRCNTQAAIAAACLTKHTPPVVVSTRLMGTSSF